MTNAEAISLLKQALAEIEWTQPMQYAAAIDKAIEVLERTRWRDAKTEPPKESVEECICLPPESKCVSIVSYSRKWDAFNACDWFDEAFAAKYSIPAAYWMPAPPLPELPKEGDSDENA